MAKRTPDTDNSSLIMGISANARESAREKAKATLTSGKNSIELIVAGGRKCIFELYVIPYDEIDEKTVVPIENQRIQRLLNEIGCADILKSLSDNGQQYPAIGHFLENGKIETADGSRRRWSCKYAKKDFIIYATRDHLTREDIKYLSEIGNISKKISLYERGTLYKALIENGTYETSAALAEGESVDKAIISVALKAHELPKEIIDYLPSIDAFGRPAVNELSTLISKANDEQLTQIFTTAKNYNIDASKETLSTSNANQLNKDFIKKLVECIPKKRARAKSGALVASNGQTKVSLANESKKGFSLNINNIDEIKKEKLLAMIKQIIET